MRRNFVVLERQRLEAKPIICELFTTGVLSLMHRYSRAKTTSRPPDKLRWRCENQEGFLLGSTAKPRFGGLTQQANQPTKDHIESYLID
jgi:hypothetical protein